MKAIIDIEKLRDGKEVKCPECKDGVLRTPYEPKVSHSFKCDKCGAKVNFN